MSWRFCRSIFKYIVGLLALLVGFRDRGMDGQKEKADVIIYIFNYLL